MTKPNTKVKVELPKLTTRAEMETAFGELAARTIERDDLMLELESALNDTRRIFNEEHGTRLTALNAEIALSQKLLHDWARANHETEFSGKQSLETRFGILKFFRGQHKAECKSKWNWDKVLARIKECGLAKRFVRTIEEPNKEALIEARDQVLRSDQGEFSMGDLGVAIKQEETFTVIVKREPITEAMEKAEAA